MTDRERQEQATQVLERASQIIDERGWWQGQYTGPDGEVCAFKAIIEASRDENNNNLARGFLQSAALQRLLPYVKRSEDGGCLLVEWNDEDGRTVEDVQLAFKKAIADGR